ncbi:MAG: UDP-glucose 4-epimerase GalE [Polyangiaceae bacterium]|nr:UDP-glucose 4-epimerase GalE [Polyangiaceae bacterium]
MILVTGGAGYIGSHYVLEERARHRDVLVLDDLSRGHREAVLDAPLVTANLNDRRALDELFTAHPIEAVVHFAAFTYVGESVAQPARYYRNNVAGTLTLLEAMRDHGVRVLVFSSSCATYGQPEYVPLDERHAQRPISPYGETKFATERMIEAFGNAYGLRYALLRYFNAAGADAEGRIGELHEPETHLIPLILQVASGRRESLQVFGTDYPTPDGTCIRDYIHVEDLVAAHSLALERLMGGAAQGIYNLGTENGHSVCDVIDAARRITGRRVRVEETARRPGDPARLVASAALARSELGWRPKHDLGDSVSSAWRWEQGRRYGAR